MERSIRIGKDFNVRWSINKVVDGERQPYELAGKELVLQYRTPYGLKEATEWKVVGNTIVWTFRGKEQKALGSYELILTENGGKDGMVTVDTCRAFKLVAHSCEETEGSGSDIVIEDVVLESEVAFAPIVIEGGGGSYDDTEIKNQLAALQQKDAEQSAKLAQLSAENETIRTEVESQNQLIEDLQNTKIDREADDYYPKLAVGLADNLAGVDVVDSEINFRRSGGGAISDGVARIESIKGNSVVWNQLMPSNKIVVPIGAYTWNAWASGLSFRKGHKYILIVDNPELQARMRLLGTSFVSPTTGVITYEEESTINDGNSQVQLSGTSTKDSQIGWHDLTKMFGVGNEPTTIDEFYQRIPLGVDLNAYNEGEVIHMDVQSIESQGVNAWDEEMVSGAIKADGTIEAAARLTTSYIEVLPNKTYYQTSPSLAYNGRYVICDENKRVIYADTANGVTLASKTFTTPSNAKYVRITFGTAYGTTYNHDICINLSDTSINGKYFPYIKRVEDLAVIRKYFPQGMKSAGSAHDEIRYNKATQKWEMVVRIGEVKMKDLKWAFNGGTPSRFSALGATDMVSAAGVFVDLMCKRYSSASSATATDKSIYRAGAYIGVWDSAYSDLASFTASLTDEDILYYQLAEPIVTELDEADQFKDLDYAVWNAGTEKAIAEGKSAPLAADITYGFNAIGKIKELESLVAALRAKVGI